MCGLAGELRFDGQLADLAALARMTGQMISRGPDASGAWSAGPVALGHQRLKIMDLAEASGQPMTDPGLGLSLVFNGAIYNYPALRGELEALGYRFFSDGDTEVVLKAYHAWGEKMLERFNGMFALAIWERDKQSLFLARDRLGIKPLYLSEQGQRLRFASSLPALVRAGDLDTSINPVALNHYLSFHSVVPAPLTIINGVQKLPPGHWLRIDAKGQREQQCWWQLQYGARDDERELPFEAWQERVLDSLRAAVKRRNLAAVDVGVLLSGGVDSSLLVGLLDEAGARDLKTFSIGFADVNGEAGNEFRYSDLIAEHYGTRHHQLMIPEQEILTGLPDALRAMSEPMVSHDCIAFYLLSREVSKHCRVVQSGQGADEIFAGYHWYPQVDQAADPVAAYQQAFMDRDFNEYRNTVQPAWAQQDHAGEFVRDHFARPGAESGLDKALRLDSTVMLVEDPVKRVDNMTMAWGLEARVPFLDHELVELSARIPGRFKLPGDGKYVLKEAARQVIPAAVIDRPKGYFPVPGLKYLQGSTLDWVRDSLTSERARERGLFNSDYVDTLLRNPLDHITPLRGSKLWQLAVLDLWLDAQGL
ncbi:asparagine synthase [Pseudomonas saudimassiliensis]|uniref:asparagine synthase (glutamine-hydrolyzing) n=1 Tax=Pseudomonas saudimassiliensis TaxID=1461581 RepID=A0A078MDF3_9PSED|nr:N-acetylglutaminylglutamine amidotransferase [Pseudomonas saudimassiliensis]CEA04249.1 asparagine synthase [Pseudomonas saudimassiliensis]CEF26493.1 asparagine synthase [Pseudomonas saudimassiliensis]